MATMIPLLNGDEVRRCIPPDEEAGFGALATPRGRLPLTALDVHARIDGLLAEMTVGQTFVNALDEPLAATYIFPLPDRAAVTRFQLQVAGRLVEGVLQERGAARRDYDQAIAQGQHAAITEEERPGVFTMRVGNLMPGERATVRLTLTGPLAYSDGEATFRFPLVVAPRYIPGIPLSGPSVGDGTASDTDAVPDASRITPPVLLPGFPNPVRLSLTVDVYPSDLAPSDFRCALHAALEAVSAGGRRRILLQPGERLDRDFLLRFRVGDGTIRTALTLTPDAAGAPEGTFALTLVPPTGPAQAARPRDVVFVLDRSGSMGGWKIVAARRALGRMVDTLTARDRFTVYAFDDRIEKPTAFADLGLQTASDRNRFRALEFLAVVEARGGTEMSQPLSLAAHLLAGGELTPLGQPQRDRVLVLITDGQVANEDQILHGLANELKSVRVFALGIDQAVNAAFLRRLADLGGGACELVESEDRLDEVLEQVHRRLGTPVLTGMRLEAAGLQLANDALVPSRLPDLFAGTPLHLLGRYRGAAGGSIRLSAATPAGGPWSQSVAGRAGAGGAIPSVWARGHIRELEDRFVTGKGNLHALEKRIVETSLTYGVLCRFTAFLAVDRSATPNASGASARILQPVAPPPPTQLVKELGLGAIGTVYLARDGLGRQVVLKRLDDGICKDPDALARLHSETQSAAALQHPNICPVYGISEVDGIPFLTLAYIEGEPLSTVMRREKPMAPRRVVEIVAKLARALHYAHERGVIHGDLKPSSIMMNHQGEPILMDFGLVRRLPQGVQTGCEPGLPMTVGTPAYMSPEQVKGEPRSTGPASEQWSLGVLFYEMLTGQLPFQGSILQIFAGILTKKPLPPCELGPDLDPALEAICLRAMSTNIAERFPAMADFALALENFLTGREAVPQASSSSARRPSGCLVYLLLGLVVPIGLWTWLQGRV